MPLEHALAASYRRHTGGGLLGGRGGRIITLVGTASATGVGPSFFDGETTKESQQPVTNGVQQPVANGPQHHTASDPVSTPPVAPHQHVTSLPSRVSVGSTAGTSGYVRNPIRGDERGASGSCRQDTLSPTVATPMPSPQPPPQPPLKPTPAPRLQPSSRATPSLLGKRRRDDEADEVLRQMLYESRRLADLTEARNRQDAAFQQSMLEGMRDVAAAVRASNGQQELLIQNVNMLTLILQKQLDPHAPH
ncbi:hypothetical protein V5799_005482 [Amblyomma americanum]|uniref:Uncharacterized protein n=1 Tax=Amblyomma americanum TaxID=6943 RepID=A0AAQ4DZ47_AMBAM